MKAGAEVPLARFPEVIAPLCRVCYSSLDQLYDSRNPLLRIKLGLPLLIGAVIADVMERLSRFPYKKV